MGLLGKFWTTVALVEVMDLAFSIDNVFAAVAFQKSTFGYYRSFYRNFGHEIYRAMVCAFNAKVSFLETIAFIVIAILGVKLTLSLYEHFYPTTSLAEFLSGHTMEVLISATTVLLFVVPIITSYLFEIPKRSK